MGEADQSKPFAILFACLAASLLLVVIGFVLRRRGSLASRNAALGWAILCLIPLFGAGAALMIKHQVELATGVTEPGENEGKVFQNESIR
jgi:hypothetical protein